MASWITSECVGPPVASLSTVSFLSAFKASSLFVGFPAVGESCDLSDLGVAELSVELFVLAGDGDDDGCFDVETEPGGGGIAIGDLLSVVPSSGLLAKLRADCSLHAVTYGFVW